MRSLIVRVALLATALAGCDAIAADVAPSASAPGPQLNQWMPLLATVVPESAVGEAKNPAQSAAINVSMWPTNKVVCGQSPRPGVDLYLAKNSEPGELIKQSKLTQRQQKGTAFPALEFADVRASLAADPKAMFKLTAFVRGQPVSNVWVHAGDSHPEATKPLEPGGYSSPEPAALDTRIQIVFPHDDHGKQAPPKSATRVNVAVDVFQHGTTLSVPPDAKFMPQLRSTEGNGPMATAPPGVQKTTYTVNGQGYPRWVFNDVAVKPGHVYNFLAVVAPLGQPGGSYPTIWTYAEEPRTSFPNPPTPPPCIA